MPSKLLITGGAGFIGSNLTESFLDNNEFSIVRIIDNLSTGHLKNLTRFIDHPKFEFVEGDIRDKETCAKACDGIDLITHQAALGSVPRSINDPIASTEVNVNGFLNVLWAAKEANIKRVVYASSSSVYGDLTDSPKQESRTGKLLSPYAATKMSNELFAEAFAKNYGMTISGLRYFNIFGRNQDPNGPYAAVIPLFFKAALTGQSPNIYGDGTIARDFTPVKNVVQINQHALLQELPDNKHLVFNVACGQSTTLNKIWSIIAEITDTNVKPNYGPQRQGDILQSLADITMAKNLLGYKPETDLTLALKSAIDYYRMIVV